MSEVIQRIEIKEFREFGYLQEVNRIFFHPLGLALEVTVEEDGTEHLGGVWDSRLDPEGLIYGEGMIEIDKANRVKEELNKRAPLRLERVGYVIQPVENSGSESFTQNTDS